MTNPTNRIDFVARLNSKRHPAAAKELGQRHGAAQFQRAFVLSRACSRFCGSLPRTCRATSCAIPIHVEEGMDKNWSCRCQRRARTGPYPSTINSPPKTVSGRPGFSRSNGCGRVRVKSQWVERRVLRRESTGRIFHAIPCRWVWRRALSLISPSMNSPKTHYQSSPCSLKQPRRIRSEPSGRRRESSFQQQERMEGCPDSWRIVSTSR